MNDDEEYTPAQALIDHWQLVGGPGFRSPLPGRGEIATVVTRDLMACGYKLVPADALVIDRAAADELLTWVEEVRAAHHSEQIGTHSTECHHLYHPECAVVWMSRRVTELLSGESR